MRLWLQVYTSDLRSQFNSVQFMRGVAACAVTRAQRGDMSGDIVDRQWSESVRRMARRWRSAPGERPPSSARAAATPPASRHTRRRNAERKFVLIQK